MKQVASKISGQTTVWRAWLGFNASHSLGAMLFGLIYGYLALAAPQALLQDGFLLALGLLYLASMTLLARRYWFNIPLIGISLALALFLAAIILQAMPL
ncbi:MAG: LIC_13387 family protein [Pseudomonas sp.]